MFRLFCAKRDPDHDRFSSRAGEITDEYVFVVDQVAERPSRIGEADCDGAGWDRLRGKRGLELSLVCRNRDFERHFTFWCFSEKPLSML